MKLRKYSAENIETHLKALSLFEKKIRRMFCLFYSVVLLGGNLILLKNVSFMKSLHNMYFYFI